MPRNKKDEPLRIGAAASTKNHILVLIHTEDAMYHYQPVACASVLVSSKTSQTTNKLSQYASNHGIANECL